MRRKFKSVLQRERENMPAGVKAGIGMTSKRLFLNETLNFSIAL